MQVLQDCKLSLYLTLSSAEFTLGMMTFHLVSYMHRSNKVRPRKPVMVTDVAAAHLQTLYCPNIICTRTHGLPPPVCVNTLYY